jgi:AcrR family transcriptional regulator
VESDPVNAERRRKQILQAATALFVEREPTTVSIRDLENATGLTRGAIYYYYDSKEAFYFAVLVEGLRSFRDRVVAELADDTRTASARIEGLVQLYVGEYSRDRSMFILHLRYFFGEYLEPTATAANVAHMTELIAECIDAITATIEQGRDAHELTSSDPRFDAMAMWGLLSTVVQMQDNDVRMAHVARPVEQLTNDLVAHLRRNLQVVAPGAVRLSASSATKRAGGPVRALPSAARR